MHKELPKFLAKLKERGFQVKLDTNGFYPEVLENCLPFVDYVALDVKTSLEKYGILGDSNTDGLMRTIQILKTGKTPCEFRTTLVPGIVESDDVTRIGELVKGVEIFAFQQFVPEGTLDKSFETVKPYSPEIIAEFSEIMQRYVNTTIMRV